MKILIIGGGNMGLTYARSFLKAHIVTSEDLMILEKAESRSQELEKEKVGSLYNNPEDCLSQADLIIFAVKPQDIDQLFPVLRPYVDPQQVFLSIMAGVKMERIRQDLGVNKLVRAMPNLPAQVGMGMTAFTASSDITRIELVTVQNLLNTTGKTIYVETEDLIDATTAISGSGPAYVYYYMNAMMTAARDLGFNEAQAELLVAQTFMGSVHLQNRNTLNCQEWIDKVSSKGGTTEAAMHVFSHDALDQRIIDGVKAAYKRAVELGGNK